MDSNEKLIGGYKNINKEIRLDERYVIIKSIYIYGRPVSMGYDHSIGSLGKIDVMDKWVFRCTSIPDSVDPKSFMFYGYHISDAEIDRNNNTITLKGKEGKEFMKYLESRIFNAKKQYKKDLFYKAMVFVKKMHKTILFVFTILLMFLVAFTCGFYVRGLFLN